MGVGSGGASVDEDFPGFGGFGVGDKETKDAVFEAGLDVGAVEPPGEAGVETVEDGGRGGAAGLPVFRDVVGAFGLDLKVGLVELDFEVFLADAGEDDFEANAGFVFVGGGARMTTCSVVSGWLRVWFMVWISVDGDFEGFGGGGGGFRDVDFDDAVFEVGGDAGGIDLGAEFPLALDLAGEGPVFRGFGGELKEAVGDFQGDFGFGEAGEVEADDVGVSGVVHGFGAEGALAAEEAVDVIEEGEAGLVSLSEVHDGDCGCRRGLQDSCKAGTVMSNPLEIKGLMGFMEGGNFRGGGKF